MVRESGPNHLYAWPATRGLVKAAHLNRFRVTLAAGSTSVQPCGATSPLLHQTMPAQVTNGKYSPKSELHTFETKIFMI